MLMTPPITNSETDLQDMGFLPLYPPLESLYLPSSSTETLQYDDFLKYLSFNNNNNEVNSNSSSQAGDDKLQIRILGVPSTGAKSRVETQIKLCIQLMTDSGQKVMDWSYIRIDDNMLARSRLRKNKQNKSMDWTMLSDESKVLQLEAIVTCASNTDYPIRMCVGCVRRERKRAERTKSKTEPYPEDLEAERDRILLFNCSSMINFSSGDAILPTRITCYCRHHNEKLGFRICFKLRDNQGNVIASGTSPPIMITDDHKSLKKRKRSTEDLDTPAPSRRSSMDDQLTINTPPPFFQTPSADEEDLESTTPTSTDFLSFDLNSITPPTLDLHHPLNTIEEPWPFNRRRKTISGYTSSDLKSVLSDNKVPQLDRLVPARGPTYGGVEVTLLGSGFCRGLTCLFGENPATTVYWNANTLVCILPPATKPGPVVVSFKEYPVVLESQDVAIFTYQEASDHALFELALQVVGLKMTGKLHDAKHVAMQICQGNDKNSSKNCSNSQQQVLDALEHVECLDLSLQNSTGHSLLHLAVLLDNKELVRKLLLKQDGLRKLLDIQDKNDMTALQLAKSKEMVQILLGSSHKKPLSRRNSFKSLMVHRFHNLTSTSTEGQSPAIMESKGLGLLLLSQQKKDLPLYLFWFFLLFVPGLLFYILDLTANIPLFTKHRSMIPLSL